MNTDISIIIVTYNSQQYISSCLTSIEEYLDIEYSQIEIIVVDNSSGESAKEMQSLVENHPLFFLISIKYIHNVANLGYGHGNNVGIKESKGKIICIMNPDVQFVSPLLQDVKKNFKEDNLGLLGYKQIGGLDYSFYLKPEHRNSFFGMITKFVNKIDLFFPKYFYLSGAFFFVDRKKFEEIGLFDENIFMYFEEPDVANRLENVGYKIKYDNSKIYHHLIEDRIDWSESTFRREMDSLLYYLKKYSIDKIKYFRKMNTELKIKLKIAKILNDNKRMESFENELILRKEY